MTSFPALLNRLTLDNAGFAPFTCLSRQRLRLHSNSFPQLLPRTPDAPAWRMRVVVGYIKQVTEDEHSGLYTTRVWSPRPTWSVSHHFGFQNIEKCFILQTTNCTGRYCKPHRRIFLVKFFTMQRSNHLFLERVFIINENTRIYRPINW